MTDIDLSDCNLQLSNGDRILSDLSLELPAGQVTWVVGESGAGKSTLCNLLAGLTPARAAVSGRLRFDAGQFDTGQLAAGRAAGRFGTGRRGDICIELGTRRGRRQLAELRRRGELSWAPQNAMDTFPPRVRLREWFRRAGIKVPKLAPFGLEDTMLDRFPHELSGGQISRVSLAAALSHAPTPSQVPALLVCDEPTAGLDLAQTDAVAGILNECAKTQGSAILAVTHDLSGMARNAGPEAQVAVIFDGHIVESCTVADFLNGRSANAYSRALAAAAPDAGAHPLPLRHDHLGRRGYRDGDELARLDTTVRIGGGGDGTV